MKKFDDAFIKNIAAGVLEKACRDAKGGDPLAAYWLLTRPALEYAALADVREETLGELAFFSLEFLINGR
jgi:hypothetical protein